MSKAVFPGSFDPVTVGHLDLIRRASRMFDELVVGVLINSGKHPMFTRQQRVDMLRELTGDMPHVTVEAFDGLLIDFVDRTGADAIVRGIRNSVDFEYELPLAQGNHKLNSRADTVFLATAPEYSYISSTMVKEVLQFGGDVQGMVPDIVLAQIKQRQK